jgi:hypothetical protein
MQYGLQAALIADYFGTSAAVAQARAGSRVLFIQTGEDLYEALAGSSPTLGFGLAFCESSGPRLVRRAGNDEELVEAGRLQALSRASRLRTTTEGRTATMRMRSPGAASTIVS